MVIALRFYFIILELIGKLHVAGIDVELLVYNKLLQYCMSMFWNSQILHPETSHKGWLQLVKYSFMSKIMSPVTSFIVVENEAQKAMLKKKQEQVLKANKSLDVGEDTQRMSEPSTIILVLLFGLVLFYRERRKRKLKTIS